MWAEITVRYPTQTQFWACFRKNCVYKFGDCFFYEMNTKCRDAYSKRSPWWGMYWKCCAIFAKLVAGWPIIWPGPMGGALRGQSTQLLLPQQIFFSVASLQCRLMFRTVFRIRIQSGQWISIRIRNPDPEGKRQRGQKWPIKVEEKNYGGLGIGKL